MVDTVRFVPTQSFGLVKYGVLSASGTVDITVPAGTSLIYYSLLATYEVGDTGGNVFKVRVEDITSSLLLFAFNVGKPTATSPVVEIGFGPPGLLVVSNTASIGTAADKTVRHTLKVLDASNAEVTPNDGKVNLLVGYQLVPVE